MKDKTNLQKLIEHIYQIEYVLTATEKMIVQKQRNELKYNLLEGIIDTLVEQGLDRSLIHRTTDGYILELQNKELGYIPISIDLKVKDIDYSLEEAIIEWNDKVEDQKRKEKLKLAKEKEKLKKEQEREKLKQIKRERLMGAAKNE